MELIRDYWWLVLLGAVILLVLVLLLSRRQRVALTNSAPIRPHMAAKPQPTTGIVAAALNRTEHHPNDGDDLTQLKGVGPSFADAFIALGLVRFEQIAGLTATEIERLDAQLGAFRGRIIRDRIVEQADYLARKDIDGFEQRFGKL